MIRTQAEACGWGPHDHSQTPGPGVSSREQPRVTWTVLNFLHLFIREKKKKKEEKTKEKCYNFLFSIFLGDQKIVGSEDLPCAHGHMKNFMMLTWL